MKIKKTWFSYLLWGLMTGYTGILSAVYLSGISVNLWHFNKYGTAFFIGVMFALTVGIWFLGRKAWTAFADKLLQDPHLVKIWECFLTMCLFAGAVLYRIYGMLHFSGAVEGSAYYEMAAVKSGTGIPEIGHGASYLYTCVLSFVLSFMGNKVAAAVFLQLLLQMGALVFFYFAVRRLAGRTAAFCVVPIMAFLPGVNSSIFVLSPEALYFFLYAAGLWLMGWYAGQNHRNTAWIAAALTGIYTGVLGYSDISGWTLLFFAVAVSAAKAADGTVGERVEKRKHRKTVAAQLILHVAAAVTAMTGCIYADAVISESSFGRIWQVWMEQYGNISSRIILPSGPDGEWIAGAVLCLLAALGTIGFWFHKEQKQDAWILLLAALGILEVLQAGPMRYGILTTAVWALFAGLGAASIQTEEAQKQEAGLPELTVEEITEDAEIAETAEHAEETSEKKEIKFIENPLPLPKKHQKKEMDFDREIEENEFKFDLDVSADDDFDIS